MKRVIYGVALLLTAIPCIASASSPDAWNEFYKEVKQGCLQKNKDLKIVGKVYDSNSFGFVLMTGKYTNAVCVFDKQTKEIEIADVQDVKFIPTKIKK